MSKEAGALRGERKGFPGSDSTIMDLRILHFHVLWRLSNQIHSNTMIKRAIVSILFASLVPLTAGADTIKFPKEAPVVSLDIPSTWKPKQIDDYLECNSPDGVATLYVQVADSDKAMKKEECNLLP